MSATTPTIDQTLKTLQTAIEQRDAAALIGLYADDAEMRIMDRIHQPSHPTVLRGKAEIAAYWQDICGRDMTHRVEQIVGEGGSVAFSEACQYPDGTRVQCITMLELRDGKIARQVGVQTWDE